MPERNKELWDGMELEATGHEGSARMALSATGVLGAWGGSLLLHVAAFAAMFLVVFPFSADQTEKELPVAGAQLVGRIDAIPPSPIEVPRPDFKSKEAAIDLPILPLVEPNHTLDELIHPGALKDPELSILGIGAGGGDRGLFSAAAAPGGELGPDFFGLGGSARGARTIVYVVDRSASMQSAFGLVKRELRRSISALRRSQKFHVIFFAGRAPLEFAPRRCVNAIEVYKEQFFAWLDRLGYEGGGTVPAPALRRALSMNPDVLYFLTDANGENFSPALRAQLDDWNKDRRTRIFTIAYLQRDAVRFLEALARDHGGDCRFVSDDALP